jgi:hypothetical protein
LRRFPTRTLILMAAAVAAFIHLWIVTHRKPEQQPDAPAPRPGMAVDVASPSAAPKAAPAPLSPACGTLDRALEAVARNPGDAGAVAEARQKLEACAEPATRACELGPALDARAPLTAQPSPARELLGALCQRCPAEANPCATLVSRALRRELPERKVEPSELRWNLEHAGPAGTAAACAVLVREALAPAAVTGQELKPEHPALLTELGPACSKAGHLPVAVVNAALVQRGAQAGNLAPLAVMGPTYLKPSQVTGPEEAQKAFDESDKKGVELSAVTDPHQETEGALRARFDPPLKQLVALRINAKGPGTLRAIIRAPAGVGLEDKPRNLFFVDPTVCQFQGVGQWELCTLGLPLLDVEALTVHPLAPKITVLEIDVQGTRY